MSIIGKRIARVRNAQSIQQKTLAIELNVSASTVCRWERGELIPKVDTLMRIAAILNCDVALLMAPEHQAVSITVHFTPPPPAPEGPAGA